MIEAYADQITKGEVIRPREAFVTVRKEKTSRLLQRYKDTLMQMKPRFEGEPVSGLFAAEAEVVWRAEKAPIGFTVVQEHRGVIRKEMRKAVDEWVKAHKPFPTSGGFYCTVPNKSFDRIVSISKQPEIREFISQLGMEEEWLDFWDIWLEERAQTSRQMLELLKSGQDKEVFSRQNELAGTGLRLRGQTIKREDLANHANSLDFLVPYAREMGRIFAAIQLAQIDPDESVLIDVNDSRVRGAMASRSDAEVLSVNWNGEVLQLEVRTKSRQVGSDATGVLSNSASERKYQGQSVTEKVLRQFKSDKVIYPFEGFDNLIKLWALPSKPNESGYVIGEDLGMEIPKIGADNLFCKGFAALGGRYMPLMFSGSVWTQAVYAPFHKSFARKTKPGESLVCLGDDINYITNQPLNEAVKIFDIYKKIKSTNPDTNTKKVLGYYTSHEGKFRFGIVPRVIKTISSASKRGGYWEERLSDLAPDGRLQLQISPEVEESIRLALPIVKDLTYLEGKPEDALRLLQDHWGTVSKDTLATLALFQEAVEERYPKVEEPVE